MGWTKKKGCFVISKVRENRQQNKILPWIIPPIILIIAAFLGYRASFFLIIVLLVLVGGLILLRLPISGLLLLLVIALVGPVEFNTGTEVSINPTTILVPVLMALWGLTMLLQRQRPVPARANRPLFLFLLAGLVSLVIGNATWDVTVPKSSHFILVQLAQWTIFALSAGAFWLGANLLRNERWLQRLTYTFLLVGGSLALLIAWLGIGSVVNVISTLATFRTPFWILLTATAGGQLLFNRQLNNFWRLFCLAILAASVFYAFILNQEAAANWVGLAGVATMLFWLRLPRLHWPVVIVGAALVIFSFPFLYEFAGGEEEWLLSGAPRLVLSGRVIEVTLHNPITGIGPASYRPYTMVEPLVYQRAYWVSPRVSAHNNYVDIFAHTGLVGLGLFLWFMAEVGWLAWRLHKKPQSPFAQGFVAAMLATWFSIMGVMLLLDWFLPFVYNVGFPGFQASVLVWLFFGGLVALDNFEESETADDGKGAVQASFLEHRRPEIKPD